MPTKQSKTKRMVSLPRPLEERLRVVREVKAYRAAHKGVPLADAIKGSGHDDVTDSNYYAWAKRAELAELTRKANGNGEDVVETHSFPLSLIPERETRAKRGTYKKLIVGKALSVDNGGGDTNLVASLLEVLAKHLRR